MRYVYQMKGYQEKMKEYEKAHKDMDSAPAHAVNFSYPVNNHGPLSKTSSRIMTLYPAPPVDRIFGSNQTLSETVIGERYYGYNLKGSSKNTRNISLAHTIASRASYGIRDTTKLPLKNVLYIVNDKKVNRTYIQKLNPQDISSISVLKNNKAAILEYGPAAKEGVIKIYTKEYEKQHAAKESDITFSAQKVVIRTPDSAAISSFAASPATPVIFNLPDSVKPVIFLNGKLMKDRLALGKVPSSEIDSVVVIKRNIPLLIKEYGAQAKNGVIKIYTKVE